MMALLISHQSRPNVKLLPADKSVQIKKLVCVAYFMALPIETPLNKNQGAFSSDNDGCHVDQQHASHCDSPPHQKRLFHCAR